MSEMLANGVRLNFDIQGNPADPTMVLIRGLGTQMSEWHPDLLQQLQDLGLQILIFDNRDVGLSEKLADRKLAPFAEVVSGEAEPPYTLTDMAADVCGLLDGLNIESAHVLGISLGGMIAQVMAAQFPARVTSMLSVMSSSGSPGLPGPSDAAMAAFNEPVPETPEAAIEQTARHKVVFGSPGYPESLEQRLADAQASYERCHYPEGVARQRRAAASQLDRSEMLQTIQKVCTVIHGEDDALIPLACGEDTARLIPNAHFVAVPGMGHNIPKGLVPEFVQFVAEHLQRARASES
jgi:proline iminopeptidase